MRLEVNGGCMHCRFPMRAVVRGRSEGLVGHLAVAAPALVAARETASGYSDAYSGQPFAPTREGRRRFRRRRLTTGSIVEIAAEDAVGGTPPESGLVEAYRSLQLLRCVCGGYGLREFCDVV